MKAMADVCVSPIGVGVSVSQYVVECQKIFQSMDLDINMHAYGTNIEGEWDEVMEAIKRCHETLHEMGAPRIGTTIRLGTRTDREQSINDKIESVNNQLGQ
ncbi:MAG: MTH1187 family thiamine-binding protein [Gammaproteobacteria bacterium]|nr:MTH1187 family thiamine-binding protein [Gammaproteobacteria bacterium]